MIISKKKFNETLKKIENLEKRVNFLEKAKIADPVDEISYKEVIDEWLNGKIAKQI